jgi:glutamate synthase domain-containing protein 1
MRSSAHVSTSCRRQGHTGSASASCRTTTPAGLSLGSRREDDRREGQRLLLWRDVPVDGINIGETANAYAPVIRQVIVYMPGRAPGRVRAEALRHPPRVASRSRG